MIMPEFGENRKYNNAKFSISEMNHQVFLLFANQTKKLTNADKNKSYCFWSCIKYSTHGTDVQLVETFVL